MGAKNEVFGQELTITDDREGFADIGAGATREDRADFDFTVSSATPAGHRITFTLHITASNGGPWTDTFTVTVGSGGGGGGVGPIVYDHVSVDDDNSTSRGNNNGAVDAGEKIELNVFLKNTGSSGASSVYADLSSSDSYVTITDDRE
ncbi:MAG: hypothetical protein KAJ81_08820, partial [Candidatus Latescibacteria bacterium]|nr:hypothetical protein [Candidatus Latescibacterota bacterium]